MKIIRPDGSVVEGTPEELRAFETQRDSFWISPFRVTPLYPALPSYPIQPYYPSWPTEPYITWEVARDSYTIC